MKTKELIEKCINKHPKAWNKFISEYKGIVSKCVKHKLKSYNLNLPAEEHRDITQEIFLSMWNNDKLAGIKDLSSIDGWIAVTALNHTANYCRSLLRKRTILNEDIDSIIGTPKELHLKNLADNDIFSSDIEINEFGELLDDFLSTLPYRDRLICRFLFFDGRTLKEISKMLNLPSGTVSTVVRRSKRDIIRHMKKYYKK